VRLLTIHASKGLEAPVVFLADSARDPGGNHGVTTLVRWPAESDRPGDFLLPGNRNQRDSISQHSVELEYREERRESANLLYVALTRARNMLVVSGCAPGRTASEPVWYQQLVTALCDGVPPEEPWVRSSDPPTAIPPPEPRQKTPAPVDARLRAPLQVAPVWQEIAPSHAVSAGDSETGDDDGVLRGLVIHRLLQFASDRPHPETLRDPLLLQVANEYRLDNHDPRLQAWWEEVLDVLTGQTLAWLMQPGAGFRVYREMPVQYRSQQRTVFGVVDRLVVGADRVHVVDYKSHRLDRDGSAGQLAAHYRPQMALYREAVQRLWPRHGVCCYLLLTAAARLVEVP
jgi:ATP-dependent helicase/nuclease subunit A